MKHFLKRTIAVLIVTSLLAMAALTGCGDGGTKVGDTVEYGIWLLNAEDSTYYSDYRNNPAIEYLLTKTWGPDNKKVDLEFFVPVAGAQQENFNTLLATGDYPDMMDATMYNGSLVDLYEQGTILDLTDYIDQYMPNYKAFLAANPDLAKTATNLVNGEKRYLSLNNYRDALGNSFRGFIYRRDWIVKYGVNPIDGSKFSGSYTGTLPDGTVDTDTWVDDVVFPSGGYHPKYISDWEWMFEIFTKAIEDQNISDGYCLSLFYPGYIATGDLVCTFGGGTNTWYKTPDEEMIFGGTTDDFRAYVQAMNTWFANGWVDKAFAEHSSDLFFRIDENKFRSGKVGLWYGSMSQLLGRLDDGEGLKAGMVCFASPMPINDIYGGPDQQMVEPYTLYQVGRQNLTWFITDKVKEKDIVPLLTMLDYMYSEEGSMLGTLGLNKEQYELTKNELYTRYELTEGSYYRVPEDQVVGSKIFTWFDTVALDGGMLGSAVRANRFFHMNSVSRTMTRGAAPLLDNYEQWSLYENTGYMISTLNTQLTPDEQKTVTKTNANTDEFMSKSIPPFIRGEKDPYDDAAWEAFVKALNKYSPDKVTAIYQDVLDKLNS